MNATPPNIAVASTLLRAATFAYPHRFRRRFAAEMNATFEARCDEAWRNHGVFGLFAAIGRSLVDVLRAGLGERLARRRTPARTGAPTPLPDPPERPPMLDTLIQDFRFATRILRSNPGFTSAAILTLALGIGANTAIFSFIDALLGRPMPGVNEPGRVIALYTSYGDGLGVSNYLDYRDFSERLDTVSGMAAYKPRTANVGDGSEVEQVSAMLVSGTYFDLLGIEIQPGRAIGPDDDVEPDAHPVTVISHGLWQRRFASDPGVVGRDLVINGRDFTIIGVAPAGFRGTWIESGPDVYVPMAMQEHMMPGAGFLLDRRGWGGILVLARLDDGETLASANAEIASVGRIVAQEHSAPERVSYRAVSLAEGTMFPEARERILGLGALLGGIVGLVLLVACVNVTNLMLSRAQSRTRELAVRQALGAGRGRITRQLLAESLLLSALGGLAGLGIGVVLARALGNLPLGMVIDTSLDMRILAFCAGTALLSGLATGLVPARRAARLDVNDRLRGSRGDIGRGGRLTAGLVVAQVAVSIVLLVAAGLFTRTLWNLNSADPGFDPELATLGTDPILRGYSTAEIDVFYSTLLSTATALPGIEEVTLVNALPGPDNDDRSTFSIAGFTPDRNPSTYFNFVGPNYFKVTRIPLIAGRDFAVTDDARAPAVLVLNQVAAELIEKLAGVDALGAQLSFQGPDGPFAEVVGIAANSATSGLRDAPRATAYAPRSQVGGSGLASRMTLLARTTGAPPVEALAELRGAVALIDAALPVFGAGTLEGHLGRSIAQERLTATAIAGAALLTVTLALVGLYGVLAYAVSQRTAELGVRMALGADARRLVSMVLRQAAWLLALGAVLGIVGAVATTRFLEGFLYGVAPIDAATYAAVLLAMAAAAGLAAWLPARRATTIDPVRALRRD